MPPKPTKRERKAEARQRRLEELKRRQRRATMRKFYWWGGGAAVIALIVVLIMLSAAHGAAAQKNSEKIAKRVGCDAPKSEKSEGRQHVPNGQHVTYHVSPPTSGDHWISSSPPLAPEATGIHSGPIQDEQQVHNLEHGHMAIQYQPGQISTTLISKLEDLVRAHPNEILMAPRPSSGPDPAPMTFKLAFTAWDELQGCNAPTDDATDAAKDFFKRFQGKAPESIPGTPVFETSAPAPSPSASASASASTKPKPKPTPKPTPKTSVSASVSASPK